MYVFIYIDHRLVPITQLYVLNGFIKYQLRKPKIVKNGY